MLRYRFDCHHLCFTSCESVGVINLCSSSRCNAAESILVQIIFPSTTTSTA
ncbi:hypothetical protein Hanom_Chr09g00849301 [Helianthus anomalus]